jgi:HNH endonuclease
MIVYQCWIKRGRGSFCSKTCLYRGRTEKADEEFWTWVNKTSTCWLWTGFIGHYGYGLLTRKNRTLRAHRYSYEREYGPIPVGLNVLHRCDVRACVRPSHLFLGSFKENMEDASAKGRLARGEGHWKTILTESDIRTIRNECAQGIPMRELAARFNTTVITIWRIKKRMTWQHVA